MLLHMTKKTADAAETAAESAPAYAGDRVAEGALDEDGLGYEGECPICAAHRDPVTGEERFNARVLAAFAEGDAMLRGEIPAKWYTSTDEMWEDLMRDDPDDMDE